MPQKLRDRGNDRTGQRWVDENYDIKKEIKEKNGGIFPKTPAFTTSEFEGSDEWSEENPPDILFYLQPPPPEFRGWEPQTARDEYGNLRMSPHRDSELRRIPILPDRISIDVPGWVLVAWRRLDPRIMLQDIIDRMTPDLGEAQKLTDKTVLLPKKNSLQNNCARNCRQLLGYYNDYGRRQDPHRAEVEAMESLTPNNIRYNTILPYDPDLHRLVKVKFVRNNDDASLHISKLEVTDDNLEETTYPVDHFVFNGYNSELSIAMSDAVSMLWILQERAVRHGLNPSYWRRLEKSCLPASWFDRVKEKAQPNDTYDGGCDVCTWKSPADDNWQGVDFHKPPPRTPRRKKIKFINENENAAKYESDESSDDSIDQDLEWALDSDDAMEVDMLVDTRTGPYPKNTPRKRKTSGSSPLPLKRSAKARNTVVEFDGLAGFGNANTIIGHTDEDLLDAGAWSQDQFPILENFRGRNPYGRHLASPPQTPVKQTMENLSYFESSSFGDGRFAAGEYHQALSSLAYDNDNPNSSDELQARLHSSLRRFSMEQSMASQTSEMQPESSQEVDVTNHNQPMLNVYDPFFSSPAQDLTYNDNDVGMMYDLYQLYSNSPAQLQENGIEAAGIG